METTLNYELSSLKRSRLFWSELTQLDTGFNVKILSLRKQNSIVWSLQTRPVYAGIESIFINVFINVVQSSDEISF